VLNKQQPIPFEENTMANNKLLQQMLEHLVNDDQAKAEELFHEYVVTASREIYESLIDSEIAEETDEDGDDGEEGEDKKEKKVDEEFEEFAQEGDDDMSPMGGTPDMGDDLEADIDADMDDEDMGGASLKFGMEDTSDKGTAGGLAGNKPKVDNMGNVNVPGAKNGNAFSTKEPGHGAEKAGAKETADKSAAGLFRGRR
jgi:hypothetical protein